MENRAARPKLKEREGRSAVCINNILMRHLYLFFNYEIGGLEVGIII